ncbi:hypothetical protein, partial [Mycobacterium marinum]|uniref:hypothetical protein n=1 Tax=Mycobacterium marinum TaxID=1781 RepID=UPI0021C44A3D
PTRESVDPAVSGASAAPADKAEPVATTVRMPESQAERAARAGPAVLVVLPALVALDPLRVPTGHPGTAVPAG